MAKDTWSPRRIKACDIADSIRKTLAIHPVREGWICRPHHTNELIKVGHKDYGRDEYITSEVNTLVYTLELLDVLDGTGYVLHPCSD